MTLSEHLGKKLDYCGDWWPTYANFYENFTFSQNLKIHIDFQYEQKNILILKQKSSKYYYEEWKIEQKGFLKIFKKDSKLGF